MREEIQDDIHRETQDAAEMDGRNRIRKDSTEKNWNEMKAGEETGIETGTKTGMEAKAGMGAETKMENKKDKTLQELSIGIVVWGVLCQLTVVWFVSDKAGYSLGLWLGTFLAVGAGVHMWWALDRALDFGRDTAVKMMTKHNIIRYVVIVVVMALIMVSGFANPLAAFLGLMGLKVAAYIQPFTHKVLGYINN